MCQKQYECGFIWASVTSPDAWVEIRVAWANMPYPGFKPLSHPCIASLLLAPSPSFPHACPHAGLFPLSQTHGPLHTCKHEGPRTSALKFCLHSSSFECCGTKLYCKLPARVLLCKRDCFIFQAAVITKPLRSHQAGRWDECISGTRRDMQGHLFCFESCLPVCWEPAVLSERLLWESDGHKNWWVHRKRLFAHCQPLLLSKDPSSSVPLGLWCFKLLP